MAPSASAPRDAGWSSKTRARAIEGRARPHRAERPPRDPARGGDGTSASRGAQRGSRANVTRLEHREFADEPSTIPPGATARRDRRHESITPRRVRARSSTVARDRAPTRSARPTMLIRLPDRARAKSSSSRPARSCEIEGGAELTVGLGESQRYSITRPECRLVEQAERALVSPTARGFDVVAVPREYAAWIRQRDRATRGRFTRDRRAARSLAPMRAMIGYA